MADAAPRPTRNTPDSPAPAAGVSVVVPVKDEAENIAPLVREIVAALADEPRFEIVYVDDGSGDGTLPRLTELMAEIPQLRVVRHAASAGQSTAIATGVVWATGDIIVTLDGDGQNDPADIPAALVRFREHVGPAPVMICGHRVNRRDTWLKRLSSRVANGVRGGMLGDATPDTGCGLKVFSREIFLAMPRFDHMHRFLPALMIRQGGSAVSVPVNHRPRGGGQSKYGLWNRLWVGIVDLFGVMWLIRRAVRPDVSEVTADAKDAP